ncbi:hypothetical protein EVAR_76786_1 [Eumeta japonica]|uniref:Uncharacterized protein n=1 Tax=Eumeta variegata TaxID=151549 RepID=A0A4C1STS9_EUMVA|nr:hypothetical protein EVAR_76786_1 [Eumeta japonica]
MVIMELERIKINKLQDQNAKDEYVERLKDSLGEIKQYEYLELDELWKVTKFVLAGEVKRYLPIHKGDGRRFLGVYLCSPGLEPSSHLIDDPLEVEQMLLSVW